MKNKEQQQKLKLEHVAPYLPYGLKCVFSEDGVRTMTVCTKTYVGRALDDGSGSFSYTYSRVIPILRPLSDFNTSWMSDKDYNEFKQIKNSLISGFDSLEYNVFGNLFMRFRDHETGFSLNLGFMKIYEFLLKNHFDVFGLIDKGLAISINDIKI